MQIVRTGDMEWGGNIVPHRAGNMRHKRIFDGEDHSPDNFTLVLTDESADFYSPRHRHNWDQVRFCLEGAVPIAKGVKVEAGEVAYFPEGVPYGPQEGGPDRLVLVLQFGGASGQGYMSLEQQLRGRELLLEEGRFEKGVFYRETGEGKATQDAYEAIWQKMIGRPMHYPEPRYKAPIVMRPQGFAWRDMAGQPGVRLKRLGIFPERGLSLEMIEIGEGAAFDIGSSPDRRLIFVSDGAGDCGSEPYAPLTGVRLEPGESTTFKASAETRMLVIAMGVLAEAGG